MTASAEGMTLAGIPVLVTGASRGIGEAVARALAAAGARVALLARYADVLERLAAELGHGAFAAPCDLRDASGVAQVVTMIEARFGGPPRVLVNGAGVFHLAPSHEFAEEDFADAVAVNLIAPFRLMRAFLPAMRAVGEGYIVTIGSIADRAIYPGNTAYAATKFGARAMHEVLRTETRGTGVRATLVSPGPTDTALWDVLISAGQTDMPARDTMLRPEDVARAVLFAVTQPAHVNVDELRLSHR